MAKITVEQCKKVQTWWLKKHGYFSGGLRCGGIQWKNDDDEVKSSIGFSIDTSEQYIRFEYSQTDYWTDEKIALDYQFKLTTTPCNYGGVRFWFTCGLYANGRYCGRRVAVLYKPPGSKWFGCRNCFQLSYYDRQQSKGGKFGSLMQLFNVENQIDKLELKIKRKHWQGRPTKKYARLLKYYDLL